MGWYAGPKPAHICSHAKFNLKGCNRLAGHKGPHRNIFDVTDERWGDEAGRYIETLAEWFALIDNLANRKGEYT